MIELDEAIKRLLNAIDIEHGFCLNRTSSAIAIDVQSVCAAATRLSSLEAENRRLRDALAQIEHYASSNKVWAGVDGYKYLGLSEVRQKQIISTTLSALSPLPPPPTGDA